MRNPRKRATPNGVSQRLNITRQKGRGVAQELLLETRDDMVSKTIKIPKMNLVQMPITA